jgi:hypothetical protein
MFKNVILDKIVGCKTFADYAKHKTLKPILEQNYQKHSKNKFIVIDFQENQPKNTPGINPDEISGVNSQGFANPSSTPQESSKQILLLKNQISIQKDEITVCFLSPCSTSNPKPDLWLANSPTFKKT